MCSYFDPKSPENLKKISHESSKILLATVKTAKIFVDLPEKVFSNVDVSP